jgi:hypothetical protein
VRLEPGAVIIDGKLAQKSQNLENIAGRFHSSHDLLVSHKGSQSDSKGQKTSKKNQSMPNKKK